MVDNKTDYIDEAKRALTNSGNLAIIHGKMMGQMDWQIH
jgi:hypothetical protein